MFRALPPLTSLRAFEAAVRLGAFNLAAEELSVTPAAIGAQVRALEAWLGHPLFERRNRRVVPTSSALRLQQACETGFATIQEALTAFESDGASLTIGVGSLFASRWLSPRLSAFWLSHPGLSLRLVHSPNLENTLPNELDAAIVWGEGGWRGLVTIRLFQPRLVPVASPDYLAKHDRPVLPADLSSHLLIQEQGLELWSAWFETVDHTSHSGVVGTVAGDGTVALQLALDGQGICIGVRDFIEEDLKQGRLVALFEPVIVRDFSYFLVLRHADQQRAATKQVSDWILELGQRWADI